VTGVQTCALPIFSFIYYLSFINVNMENKECISYDLEQRTDIDVPVFKD